MNKLQEELLAKATSEKNVEDDWQSIMTLSDELLRATEKQAAAFVQSIVKKLKSGQPRVQRQAIIVVHACFQNSGATIRLAVCSAAFMSEVKRLLTDSTHSQVKEELIKSLAAWKKSFGSQYEFNLLVRTMAELENMGVRFSQSSESKPSSTKIDPSEEEAIMKAIAASLDDASSNTTKTSSTTFSAVKTKASPQRVKVLYDFEAADDQELQLHAGDIIFVIDKTDPQWWLGQDSTGDEGYFPASFVSVNLQAKTDREEKAAAAAAAVAAAEAQSQQKEPEVQGNGDLTLEQAENIFSGLSSCIANAWQSNSASEFVRDSEEQISAGRAAVNNLLEQIQEMDADIAEFESLLSQHERFDSFYQHRIQQAQAEMQAAPQNMGHHNGHGMGVSMQQHRYPGNGEAQAHQPRQPGGYGEAPYPYPAHAQQGPGGYGGQPNGYSDATQADAYGGPQNQHQQAYQPQQGQQMDYQSEQHDQRYALQSGQQDYQKQQQQYTPSVSQQQEYQPQQQQPQDYQRPDHSYHQPQQDMRQQQDYQQRQHPPQQDYAQQPPQDYRQQDYAPPPQQQQDYAPPHAPPQHQPQQQDYAPPPQPHQDYAPPQHQQQHGYAPGAPQQYMGPGQASDPYAMSAQPLQPSPYVMQ